MEGGQFLHQRQTDSCAFVRAGLCSLHAMKALEQARQLRFRDAYAGVRDGQLNMRSAPAKPDGDSTLERVLERVGEKVQHDLLPHLPVNVDQLGQIGAVYGQSEARLFDR